jgi:hypothetical protein
LIKMITTDAHGLAARGVAAAVSLRGATGLC